MIRTALIVAVPGWVAIAATGLLALQSVTAPATGQMPVVILVALVGTISAAAASHARWGGAGALVTVAAAIVLLALPGAAPLLAGTGLIVVGACAALLHVLTAWCARHGIAVGPLLRQLGPPTAAVTVVAAAGAIVPLLSPWMVALAAPAAIAAMGIAVLRATRFPRNRGV
ncbi:hypothetical protein HT102_05265 [Hoyosella sp. G463]|uniref:Uncharacterized protein n=1 Tax=Lolliginicoccus lacisalsi TaxID=2742202 RepID=A0A927JB79_9ACTN|nr:hypothetical protein [Lolliginicoccus lacisalsi]MBD8505891.1 hypothetical protein [Lolliginicoccus lacisalsi]